jgi:peptide/nickel transport system substrate-binding protein
MSIITIIISIVTGTIFRLEKQKDLEKQKAITRRDYIKTVGAAVAGLAVGGAIGYGAYPGLNPRPTNVVGPSASSFLQGGTLTLRHYDPVVVLDPQLVTGFAGYTVADNIFDRLVNFDQRGASILPHLAYSWDMSGDGKEITFHLWQGVKFHDGTELKASDVKFSFERVLDPKTQAPYFGYLAWIDKIEIVDDYTVKFSSKAPVPLMLVTMALAPSVVMNEKRVTELKGDLSSDLTNVGSGPFKFVEWKTNDHLTMNVNEDYWRGRPYLDTIIIKDIPEPTTVGVAVQSGEIDLGAGIPYDMVDQMKANKGLRTADQVQLGCFYLGFNSAKEPFQDNVTLRRAFAYAIDYDAVLAEYKGHAPRVLGPFGPELWGYPEDVKGYSYDPEQAKKLLADAGYPNGLDINFNTTDQWSTDAEIIASSFSKVGINAKLVHLDPAAHVAAMSGGDAVLFMCGWVLDMPDPDNILYFVFKSDQPTNWLHWKNDTVDELVEKARTIMDQDERANLYKQVYKIVVDQVPLAAIYGPVMPWVWSAHVNGFTFGPTNQYILRDVWKK